MTISEAKPNPGPVRNDQQQHPPEEIKVQSPANASSPEQNLDFEFLALRRENAQLTARLRHSVHAVRSLQGEQKELMAEYAALQAAYEEKCAEFRRISQALANARHNIFFGNARANVANFQFPLPAVVPLPAPPPIIPPMSEQKNDAVNPHHLSGPNRR